MGGVIIQPGILDSLFYIENSDTNLEDDSNSLDGKHYRVNIK